VKFYKAMATLTLKLSSEVWTMIKDQEKIEPTEIKLLRMWLIK